MAEFGLGPLHFGGDQGLFGLKGLRRERDLTNSLVEQIRNDRELSSSLGDLLAVGDRSMTTQQHQAYRSMLAGRVQDIGTLNAGVAGFKSQQSRLRQGDLSSDDAAQLDVMDSQADYARRMLLSQNPKLQEAGTALMAKVLDAQQSFATQNEAQHLAKQASDAQLQQQIGTQNFQRYEQLSDDYRNESTPFLNQRSAFGRVKASLAQPDSAAGDIALLFNVMKVYDPGSVVREGEFATAQNASGVPDLVLTAYNRLLRDGQRLTPEQRADFYRNVSELYQQSKAEQVERNTRYLGAARDVGVPDNMLGHFALPTDSPGDDPKDFGSPQGASSAPSGGPAAAAPPPPTMQRVVGSIIDSIPASVLHSDGLAGETEPQYRARKALEPRGTFTPLSPVDVTPHNGYTVPRPQQYPVSGVINRRPTND